MASRFSLFLGVLIVLGASGQAAAAPESGPVQKIRYHFTGEGTYADIEVQGDRLVYKSLGKFPERCAKWFASRPCWGPDDLTTREVRLTEAEVAELQRLAKESGLLELKGVYGVQDERKRYYARTLTLTVDGVERTLEYRSAPDAPPEPPGFAAASNWLLTLVRTKFADGG
jgi:hypothetical protein